MFRKSHISWHIKNEENVTNSKKNTAELNPDITKILHFSDNYKMYITITVIHEMKVNTFEMNWKTYLLNGYKLNNITNGNFIINIYEVLKILNCIVAEWKL